MNAVLVIIRPLLKFRIGFYLKLDFIVWSLSKELFVCMYSQSLQLSTIYIFFCFYNFRTELAQCGFILIRLSNHYIKVNELYSENTIVIIFKIRLKYFPQNQRSKWCIWHSPKVCTCRRRIACFFSPHF